MTCCVVSLDLSFFLSFIICVMGVLVTALSYCSRLECGDVWKTEATMGTRLVPAGRAAERPKVKGSD